jgi:integrase
MLRPRESRDLRLVSSNVTVPAAAVTWAQDVLGNAIATASFQMMSDRLVIDSVVRVEDVAAGGYTADRATVRQKKTGQPVRFELSEQSHQAIDDYLKAANKRPGEFLFTGRRGPQTNMTTRQYARLVSEWIGSVGLDPRLFGTHSLRRTKATLIYRRTGNLRAVQLLLGHTKIESTVRYLGIEVDDALAIAEQVDV